MQRSRSTPLWASVLMLAGGKLMLASGTLMFAGCAQEPVGVSQQSVIVPGDWNAPAETRAIAATQYVDVVNPPAVLPLGSCTSTDPWAGTCSHPACLRAHPGTTELDAYIRARWTYVRAGGTFSCRRNSNPASTAFLSVHSVGRAIDLMISSYSLLHRDEATLTKIDWAGVVLDEAAWLAKAKAAAPVAVAVAFMGAGFLVVFALAGGSITPELLLALVFTYLELAVVVGVALFFSVAAHPIEGAVFAFIVALFGHVTADLKDLAAQLVTDKDGTPVTLLERALEKTLDVAYVLLPNLEHFNVRAHAAHGVPIDLGQLGLAIVYAAVYVSILLGLATLVLRRKVL